MYGLLSRTSWPFQNEALLFFTGWRLNSLALIWLKTNLNVSTTKRSVINRNSSARIFFLWINQFKSLIKSATLHISPVHFIKAERPILSILWNWRIILKYVENRKLQNENNKLSKNIHFVILTAILIVSLSNWMVFVFGECDLVLEYAINIRMHIDTNIIIWLNSIENYGYQ